MSDHIQQTIEMLEQEIESHHQSVEELERALGPLRKLQGLDDDPPVARGKKRMAKAVSTRRAKPKKAARSLPDATANGDGATILDLLKKHGGVMKPGELATAMTLTVSNLRYRLKPLVKQRLIEVTGTTMSRRVRLSGMKPAKEAP